MQYYSDASHIPSNNVVTNNRITAHLAYGILLYNAVTAADNYNQVLGNYIENIDGAVLSGNAGAGVYVANQGGAVINNNTIRNCCLSTTSQSLVPAGIGIGSGGAYAPFTISGNIISNMATNCGIEVVGCLYGGTITGNTISFQTGAPTFGIYSLNCSNVTISGNNVDISVTLVSTRGIYVFGTVAYSNIVVNGNVVLGAATRGIAVECSGFTANNITVSSNNAYGGGVGCVGIGLSSLASVSVVGNNVIANTVVGMDISAVTQGRYTGNSVTSSGAISVHTTGTCTGSMWSEDNYFNGNFSNNNSGFNCRQMGAASPTTGVYQLGDTMYNTAGATPFAWLCTAGSGTSGTWTGLTIP
jgi:hypothetical protein